MTTTTLQATSVHPVPSGLRTNLATIADEELVGRMLRNDDRAWQTFLHRYGRLLLATIDRVLSRFSSAAGAADREDVYGGLIASLLANDMRKLRSFDASRGYKLSTWLGLLASHSAYDHLRDLRRRGKLADGGHRCSVAGCGSKPPKRCRRRRSRPAESAAGALRWPTASCRWCRGARANLHREAASPRS